MRRNWPNGLIPLGVATAPNGPIVVRQIAEASLGKSTEKIRHSRPYVETCRCRFFDQRSMKDVFEFGEEIHLLIEFPHPLFILENSSEKDWYQHVK
jgi:hypothetical protein